MKIKIQLSVLLLWLTANASGQSLCEMSYTWDLTTDSWCSQNENLVRWESSFATMENVKNGETDANTFIVNGSQYMNLSPENTLRIMTCNNVSIKGITFHVTSRSFKTLLALIEKNMNTNMWINGTENDEIENKHYIELRFHESIDEFTLTAISAISFTSVKITYITDGYPLTYSARLTQIGDEYLSTMYLDYPVTIPDGVNAYFVTVEDNVARLSNIDNVIPENTGVVLRSATGASFDFVQAASSSSADVSDNRLIGWITDRLVTGQTHAFYAFNMYNDVIGFYTPKGMQDGTFTARANKAYLKLEPTEAVKELRIVFEDVPTGIGLDLDSEDRNFGSYNLYGIKVGSEYKGLVIRNGRKMLIK